MARRSPQIAVALFLNAVVFWCGCTEDASHPLASDPPYIPALNEFVAIDRHPEAISTPPPIFPMEERMRGGVNNVIVTMLIYVDGSVIDARVVRSSGSEALDRAAVDGVMFWSFKPAEYQGEPVAIWATMRVEFETERDP